MSVSRSLSDWLRRLSKRERRVVLAGAAASALIVFTAFVALPATRSWSSTAEAAAVRADQLARLQALVDGGPALQAALERQRTARQRDGVGLLSGATPAIAGSRLQSLVRGYAERSRVVVTRMDAAGAAPSAGAGLAAIPLDLSLQGDIYGLTDLIFYLQHGETMLVIDELTVRAEDLPDRRATASERAPLSVTIRLHGLYAGSSGT